ncbi:MAG: hypothetical protein R3D59_01670 [Paracoccaceae bacterium]
MTFDLNPKEFFETGTVVPEQVPAMGGRLFAALVVFLLARAAVAGALQVAVISDLSSSYGSTDYDPRVAEAIRGSSP